MRSGHRPLERKERKKGKKKKGEEKEVVAIADKKIPKLYETENVPVEKKIIHQRYQIKDIGFYWLIAELDPKEKLAFGYANLNDDELAEWGYISIDEIERNGAERDAEWKPMTYSQAKEKIKRERILKRMERGMWREGWTKMI